MKKLTTYIQTHGFHYLDGFMVFNATFNNISVIPEYPVKTADLWQVIFLLYYFIISSLKRENQKP